MWPARLVLTAVFTFAAFAPAIAVEGSTAAGPIGGTDIRSAQLPPPGVYGGNILAWATAYDFVDGSSKTIPALSGAHLTKKLSGPFLAYVPDVQLLGGSIALAAIVPMGEECGHLFAVTPSDCFAGVGDPYVEIAWSRSFGTLRPSAMPGALPIFEGLSLLVGFGTVLPIGRYDAEVARNQGTTMGNNIYAFAPTVAVTYTTPPILGEGTEISAKLYLNKYLTNPTTHYETGTLVNLDFALSERIGRWQIGLAGFYAVQVEDDEISGAPISPDGRKAEVLSLGGVVNYDLPENNASLKLKTLSTVHAENSVFSHAVIFGWVKKF